MRLRKKKGAVQVMAICIMGLVVVFFWLLLGLTQLQTEYATTRLNECVSEAILSADYLDQHALSTYGYTVLDCSAPRAAHCAHNSCAYSSITLSETDAYARSYEKALGRVKDSIKASLNLGDGLSVTDRTPCGIMEVTIDDFRAYNVIARTGNNTLSEGRTYMHGMGGSLWYGEGEQIAAPNGDPVLVSGIYVDIRFKVRTFFATTTDIPVRVFVGIRQ